MVVYRESSGAFWKPATKDEFVEGIYLNKETGVGPNKSNVYYIEKLEDKSLVQIWGSTILDMRMIPVTFGQQVKITYKGVAEKGGRGKNKPLLWKVEYGDADTIEKTASKEIDEIIDKGLADKSV